MAKQMVGRAAGALGLLLAAAWIPAMAQNPQEPQEDPTGFQDYTCPFFSARREKVAGQDAAGRTGAHSAVTVQVAALLGPASAPGLGVRAAGSTNTIDQYIFQALSDAGVQPAAPTTDWEFIRRASLDLTGRLPLPVRVLQFVNDPAADKRSKLVDELIGTSSWVDKWTVFFGDLYQNNSQNSQIRRFVPGVLAFNDYVRKSLGANKPYDQMARDLITATGTNSYNQGELNFLVGGVVTGGPQQDIWDQQTANTVETFLGIAHINCLLCHNGRGHLDALSLWGARQTRLQAWGMSAFLAHTDTSRTPAPGAVNGNPYYWGIQDGTRYKGNYPLNTTTGNRPPRQPIGSVSTVTPSYLFTGETPKAGENSRAALARMITADRQFARATVNYLWEYFFGIGLVTPSNQFDPARLDPNNPPADCAANAPCTLQPSNPGLLEALTDDFINSGYDLQAMMREIVNSKAYQLSARYDGNWDPSWERLFARKLVRRLWAEEIHDGIVQSSNIIPTYKTSAWGPVNWAMQFPEPFGTPDGAAGPVSIFLNAFLRGNRDDQQRDGAGSIAQALGLMNDNFVISRMRSNGPATSLLVKSLAFADDQLIDALFLAVLSRYPSAAERAAAAANLKTNRNVEAENLLWSLYNKVDFTFNY